MSSLNHSCVEIACMENHNFNIFVSPETGNISIIPMLITVKTMELWCYKKVVDTSDLTQKTASISNYEGRETPPSRKDKTRPQDRVRTMTLNCKSESQSLKRIRNDQYFIPLHSVSSKFHWSANTTLVTTHLHILYVRKLQIFCPWFSKLKFCQ